MTVHVPCQPSSNRQELFDDVTIFSLSSNASTVNLCNSRPECHRKKGEEEVDVAASVAALKAFTDALPDGKKKGFIGILQPMFQAGKEHISYIYSLQLVMVQQESGTNIAEEIRLEAMQATFSLAKIDLPELQRHLCKAGLVLPDVKFEGITTVTALLDHAEEESGDSSVRTDPAVLSSNHEQISPSTRSDYAAVSFSNQVSETTEGDSVPCQEHTFGCGL